MNARIKQLWIDALRSGEYEQTINLFRLKPIDGSKICYCATGVLMNLYEKEVGEIKNWNTVPLELIEWAELPLIAEIKHGDLGDIIELNDEKQKSFAEIADFIEEFF
ncbi:hypothetical protein [Emticicia sp. 17c]|uniref:hypothetical protein n=1 Tax=Emticicia sp. 17c TaxID=3127704 RepID=UPI00301BD038